MTRTALPQLHDLILKLKRHDYIGFLNCYDPGETTGFCRFERTPAMTYLLRADQLKTWPLEDRGVVELSDSLAGYTGHVVYEAYNVYSWKLDEHTFSEVPTIQIIGALRTLCILRGIANHSQTAQIGKGFMDDTKLKNFGLFDLGARHSRDAMRHGCHFLLFGSKK